MYELTIYRRIMRHENKEWCKNWWKLELSMTRIIWWFFTRNLKISNICTLMGCFWPKYIMFELKKVPRSYFWLHCRLMLNFEENWLVLSKMTWRISQIFTKARSKVYKLGLLLGPFVQNRKCVSLKFTGKLCVMRMKNDAKFEEDLTCQFKIDMRNLTKFDPSTQKSQKFEL